MNENWPNKQVVGLYCEYLQSPPQTMPFVRDEAQFKCSIAWTLGRLLEQREEARRIARLLLKHLKQTAPDACSCACHEFGNGHVKHSSECRAARRTIERA